MPLQNAARGKNGASALTRFRPAPSPPRAGLRKALREFFRGAPARAHGGEKIRHERLRRSGVFKTGGASAPKGGTAMSALFPVSGARRIEKNLKCR